MTSLVVAAMSGLVTSVGPCAAPRYLAVAASVRGASVAERARKIAAFCSGTIAGYGLLACGGRAAGLVLRHSSALYATFAAALTVSACVSLLRAHRHACAHQRASRSSGALTLLGFSSSLVVSPCCTPVVLAFGAFAAAGSALDSCAGVAAFALGHLAPLALALPRAPFSGSIEWQRASATIGSAVTLALGAFYGVLA